MQTPDKKPAEQLKIRLLLSGTDIDKAFIKFGEELPQLAPGVTMVQEKEDAPRTPRFQINENLAYRAIPTGRELDILLGVITKNGSEIKLFPGLGDIHIPVFFRLYITNSCPHCPVAVENISRLAMESSLINLEIIDGTLFPVEAESDSIMSVPTLVMEEGFRWTGKIPPEEVIQFILDRDPSKLSVSTLKSMLEEGNASAVAGMMMEQHMIFPAFMDLLIHPMWSVRLGAMVVMEEIAETAPETAITIAVTLWQHFTDADHGVRGDILYLLGEIGDMNTIDCLKEVQTGDFDTELKEAAEDAILSINQRKLS